MTSQAIANSMQFTINSLPELKENAENITPNEIIVLQFWNQGLKEISSELLKFKNLQTLHLLGNKFEKLPNFIANFQHLRVLSVGKNLLTKFPPLPPNLEELYLSHNYLSTIPSLKMTKLRKITLDHNQIKKLPQDPFPLTLKTIILSHNQLSKLPFKAPLPNLKCLIANDNSLTSLPSILSQSPLRKIEIQRNAGCPTPEWAHSILVIT